MTCPHCAHTLPLLTQELADQQERVAELMRINQTLNQAILARPAHLPDALWKRKYQEEAQRNVELCKQIQTLLKQTQNLAEVEGHTSIFESIPKKGGKKAGKEEGRSSKQTVKKKGVRR